MITVSLRFDAKRFFFDEPRVLRAVGHATAKVLSRFGAFVRTRSRSSIKRRKKPSPPGQPPHAHSSEPSLKTIWFAYDPARRSVVIGPVRLNVAREESGFFVPGTVPEALEHGARIGIREKKVGRKWRSAGRRPRPGQPTRVRRVYYEPRPFMQPAFEQEQQTLPDLWADSVRKAV